jgi:hypothetical protein
LSEWRDWFSYSFREYSKNDASPERSCTARAALAAGHDHSFTGIGKSRCR